MANGCTAGGRQCDECGLWFCAIEMGPNGNCRECQEKIDAHTCASCGGYDPDSELDDDGLCEACAKDEDLKTATVAVFA